MKSINKYIVKGIACLMTGFLGACSNNGADELETLVDRVEVSRATAVEADIKDLELLQSETKKPYENTKCFRMAFWHPQRESEPITTP